ncbi:MAG: alpha-amylase family protein [Candidatus Hydrogenedentes bacterium]|nr:alpha-amylase family protein [Candidatus Hydrogenedentota bacterium]
MVVRFVHAFIFLAVSILSFTADAGVLPWRDAAKQLDPRDAAFAPVVVTPAAFGVPWGIPLADGPIRVLFVAPRFALRDAAELAARLDVEVVTVALWDAAALGRPDTFPRAIPGTSAEEVLASLHENLDKKIDLIIAANFDFAVLPETALQTITEKVRNGTGLLLAHHRHTLPDALRVFLDEVEEHDADVITHGIGEQLTGEWSSGLGFVRAGAVGEGRVVELDLQGERPEYHCLVPSVSNPQVFESEHFDTYLSLAARAARWAAGRDVPTMIDHVESTAIEGPEAVQIPPGLEEMVDANMPPGAALFQPYRLHLRTPADRTYTIRTQVRQPGRGDTPITNTWKNEQLKKGAQTYDFYVVAGAGEYWLDIWLLDKNNVVEWYSEVLTVDGWPNITDFTVQKAVVQTHDSVGLSFVMSARTRPCIALARATDTLGRVVAETHQPIAPDTAYVQLGLKFSDLIGDLLKVEVFVSDRNLPMMPEWDTHLCAYAHRYLSVRSVPQTWRMDIITDTGGSVEFNARTVYGALHKEGFTIAAAPAREESVLALARLGLGVVPLVASYAPEPSDDSTVRVPCLNDPRLIANEQERLTAVMQSVVDYSATAYSLGNSNALTYGNDDVCRAPASLAAFHGYLQKQYGDLDVLNRAWGAAHQTWEGVVPPTLEESRASKNYAGWIDFRLFMDAEFVSAHVRARNVVRAAEPRARAGMRADDYNTSFAGIDLAALASRMELIAAPADPFLLAQARSDRLAHALTAVTLPREALDVSALRWLPWFSVLHGAQAVWWPDTSATATHVPPGVSIDPLANPVAYAPEFFEETSALQTGLAALVFRSARTASGIAVYASRPSAWLNEADEQFADTKADPAKALGQVLRDAGYTFDIVTPDQCAKGKLSGYRVLFLPMVRAMSDDEINAIIAFHATGGTVIADVAPGAFDEHGVPRTATELDAVFGVRRVKPSAAGEPVNALVGLSIGPTKASAEFESLRADIGIEPVSGLVGGIAGKAPVWITLRESAGRGVLLNHSADAQSLVRATGLLEAFLQEASAKRAIEIELRKDRVFEGERFSFTFGNATLIGLLADTTAGDGEQKLTMRFDRDKHVYNLRTRIAEMRPSNVNVDLARGAAALFSVLPYEVRQCVLTVPSAMVGTRLPIHVSLETDGGTPGDHLVRIEVYALRTEGVVPLRHYFTDIVCAGGEGDGYVPFALNERVGTYRIVARDLLTGLRAESIVSLAKSQRV